jgi:hypothetical protein
VHAGRIEAGVVKPGDEVEIVGIKPGTKTSVTGVHSARMFLPLPECRNPIHSSLFFLGVFGLLPNNVCHVFALPTQSWHHRDIMSDFHHLKDRESSIKSDTVIRRTM